MEAKPDLMAHGLPASTVWHLVTLAEINDASPNPDSTGKLDQVLALLYHALRGIHHPDDNFEVNASARVRGFCMAT